MQLSLVNSYPSQLKFKSDSDPKTTDAIVANDSKLTGFAIEAGAEYIVRGVFKVSENGGDFKYHLAFDNAPTHCNFTHIGSDSTGTLIADADYAPTTEKAITLVNNLVHHLMIDGTIKGHATLAAVMDLQWAQQTSHANATLFRVGSWLEVVKV